jgi:pectate lyase
VTRGARLLRSSLVLLVLTLILATTGAAPAAAAPPPPRVPLPPPVGFGQATGGAAGPDVWVTSLADDGPGTLRAAATAAGPAWIRFAVSGTLRLERNLPVAADKTIDGRGASILITHRGLVLQQRNVIVENLRFDDLRTPETQDAILIDRGSELWIDHCSFTGAGDKLVSSYSGTDITVSWSHFFHHEQVMEFGSYSTRELAAATRVTVHHNYFDHTGYRNPRVNYGWVHAFNNYLVGWTTHGMSSVRNAQLLSEANVFEAGPDRNALISSKGKRTKDHIPGDTKSRGDLFLNGAEAQLFDPGAVFEPSSYYPYRAEPATRALAASVAAGAGWQPPQPAVAPSTTPPTARPGSTAPTTPATTAPSTPVTSGSPSTTTAGDLGTAAGTPATGDHDDRGPIAVLAVAAALAVAVALARVRRRPPSKPTQGA